MAPTRTKLLIKTINNWGSLLEAVQRVVLQALGALVLIYEVIRAILRR